jgi:hypothetical protein
MIVIITGRCYVADSEDDDVILADLVKECYLKLKEHFPMEMPDLDSFSFSWNDSIYKVVGRIWCGKDSPRYGNVELSFAHFSALIELCGVVVCKQQMRAVILHELSHMVVHEMGHKESHGPWFRHVLSHVSNHTGRMTEYCLVGGVKCIPGTKVSVHDVYVLSQKIAK